MANMRKLCESSSLLDLQLVADYLQSEKVPVEILNEHQGGSPVVPHWGLSVWAELWVRNDTQFERAKLLLEQYRAQRDQPPGSEWACPNCGEYNPGNFETCWHCARARQEEETEA